MAMMQMMLDICSSFAGRCFLSFGTGNTSSGLDSVRFAGSANQTSFLSVLLFACFTYSLPDAISESVEEDKSELPSDALSSVLAEFM